MTMECCPRGEIKMFRFVFLLVTSGLLITFETCDSAGSTPDTGTTVGVTQTTPPHNNHHHHTHRPHVTREPPEVGHASFQYDHYCHLMVYKNEYKTCYIYAVHEDDRHLVHTDSGFFALEVKLMTLAINATEPYLRDDLVVRSNKLSNLCPESFTLISLN